FSPETVVLTGSRGPSSSCEAATRANLLFALRHGRSCGPVPFRLRSRVQENFDWTPRGPVVRRFLCALPDGDGRWHRIRNLKRLRFLSPDARWDEQLRSEEHTSERQSR